MKKALASLVMQLTLAAAVALGQNTTGLIKGVIMDQQGAAVPDAVVTLTNTSTGSALTTTSNTPGLFVFPFVPAGSYALSVEARGFQKLELKNIRLASSEIRDVGGMRLVIGEVQNTVSVVDSVTPLQTASGERSGLISGTQLNDLTLKGRDFLGFLKILPGVVDTGTNNRDATGISGLNSISINGGRIAMKNMTVDGLLNIDSGGNAGMAYEPNMDTIAEVRVLTSNYQAEYGRSAGGTISVITKGGGRDLHGSGWWTHRHEGFNANDFFRNRSGLARVPYRYNIAGYSVGGPAYIPKLNANRNRVFFFVSQEFTRQLVDSGIQLKNMPTAAETTGDFSNSRNTNGALIAINDPTTARPFPGNIIPASRINPLGQKILQFLPKPNYTDPDPRLLYQQNYTASKSGGYPRRNDLIRIDTYPSSKLNGYFRYVHDQDTNSQPFGAFDYDYAALVSTRPGDTFGGHLIYTATPRLVNDLTFGLTRGTFEAVWDDPSKVQRSVIGDIPQWFPNTLTTDIPSNVIDAGIMPSLRFGGTPVNLPRPNPNDRQHFGPRNTKEFMDNVNWTKGSHSIKGGVYYNRVQLGQIRGNLWNGDLDFSVNANNPNNSGHGYANTLLGNFNTYSESTKGIDDNTRLWSLEFYVQDNWRVNHRLTIDYGVRFTHMDEPVALKKGYSAFQRELYDPKKAARLYRPGFDANNRRVGVDPVTGATVIPELIGKYVPGSGSYDNGFFVGGKDGPWGFFNWPQVGVSPRFGFAFDVTGKGTTVIRGGGGVFQDRPPVLLGGNTANNPPVSYTPTDYYGNLSTFALSGGALGPTVATFAYPEQNAKYQTVTSYSLSIQQKMPLNTVLDVAYVGNVSSHLLQTRELNPIPMYARFDPRNQDPTRPGNPLIDDFLRIYPGLGSLRDYEFGASSNYHSLQVSAQRRFVNRLGFGVSYTFGKALGVANAFQGEVASSYFSQREREYGRMDFDRTHVFSVNYIYDVPNLGKKLRSSVLGLVTDNWALSGITALSTGQPLLPTFTTSVVQDTTGSSDGARISVVGNPNLPKGERTEFRNFNTEAFAFTPVRSFGNAGRSALTGPGISNWDISMKKRFPLRHESRFLEFRGEFYNAFNHTQFSAMDIQARYDPAGRQINTRFGAFIAARQPRIISFALRLQF